MSFNSKSQTSLPNLSGDQLRLYREIKTFTELQTKTLGCHGGRSILVEKVDSLYKSISEKEFVKFIDDSSYLLKFYAFIAILNKNDSLGFQIVKRYILDSTIISYHFSGNSNEGEIMFNHLLAKEYLRYICLKYHDGSNINFYYLNLPYYPSKVNKQVYKLKNNEFNNLILSSGLKLTPEEDYRQ